MSDGARELIGRTVGGRFRLTAFLGEGAMASVYRGEQDGEPRDVAVKIMHPELLRDATFGKRFAREAKAAARIVHESSVRILEQGTDGNLFYLAMELLVGQDLFDVLARERRLPEARAARIVIQVCGALGAAHAQGIVHRDLKPENVMILAHPTEPGADLVKVLDFGIAKILDRASREDEAPGSEGGPTSSGPVSSAPPSSALTMVGGVVGTPEYMSPEQARGLPVDVRSDLYACGVLLYHLVAGRPPFKSDHVIDVLMSHADKPPPPPSTFWPDIHPALEAVILKALQKDPEARYQTAAALAGELRALLPDLSPTRSGKGRARDPFPSAPGSGNPLPGVPTGVAITAPVAVPSASEPPPPPETLRSPPTTPPPVVGAPLPVLYADDAIAFDSTQEAAAKSAGNPDKTLALDPGPAPSPAASPARTLALDPGLLPGKTLPLDTEYERTLPIQPTPAARLDRTLALDEAPVNPAARPQPVAPRQVAPQPVAPRQVAPQQVAPQQVAPPRPPVQQAGAFDKTLALDPGFELPAEIREPQGPPAQPATAALAPQNAPAATPAPAAPAPLVAPERGRGNAFWWVLAAAAVLLCVAVWLLRYLRLGAG